MEGFHQVSRGASINGWYMMWVHPKLGKACGNERTKGLARKLLSKMPIDSRIRFFSLGMVVGIKDKQVCMREEVLCTCFVENQLPKNHTHFTFITDILW